MSKPRNKYLPGDLIYFYYSPETCKKPYGIALILSQDSYITYYNKIYVQYYYTKTILPYSVDSTISTLNFNYIPIMLHHGEIIGKVV